VACIWHERCCSLGSVQPFLLALHILSLPVNNSFHFIESWLDTSAISPVICCKLVVLFVLSSWACTQQYILVTLYSFPLAEIWHVRTFISLYIAGFDYKVMLPCRFFWRLKVSSYQIQSLGLHMLKQWVNMVQTGQTQDLIFIWKK